MPKRSHTFSGSEEEHRSLAEAHGTVAIPRGGPAWRRWLAVAGPALMVAVGYMDPGNWATDLAAGSRYEYRLLWVLLLSNLIAILLQSLAARLGIVRRRDLAQACREEYPRLVNGALYALAEIAITATDLAEVIGSAIALNLLLGLPLAFGVLVSAADTILLLALARFGIRKLELLVCGLVGAIGLGMLVQIVLARPAWGALAGGLLPALPDGGALYLAIGILGATVMPHNLYLHSALVQTRRIGRKEGELRQAIRLNSADSALALNLAFFINAAILVTAAAVFYRAGYQQVAGIEEAHHLLEPLLGSSLAPIAFALALLASGQSSTITGTLAGQIVMEGHLNIRVRPWLRRLITRLAAVIPALAVIFYFGGNQTGALLVLSQVILSLQLSFAVIPLLHFVADRQKMGRLAIGRGLRFLGWGAAAAILVLNAKLAIDQLALWIERAAHPWALRLFLYPLGFLLSGLIMYITFAGWIRNLLRRVPAAAPIHSQAEGPLALKIPSPYRRVAIGLDFSGCEERLLSEVLRLLGPVKPQVLLIHVVESPAAMAHGAEAADEEMKVDRARLGRYAEQLRGEGLTAEIALGTGHPVKELARLVNHFGADLVILGGHGHRGLGDLWHGSTADQLRHRVKASVLVVPLAR